MKDTMQQSCAMAIRYLADAIVYPTIAQTDLEHAQEHLDAALAHFEAQQEKAA